MGSLLWETYYTCHTQYMWFDLLLIKKYSLCSFKLNMALFDFEFQLFSCCILHGALSLNLYKMNYMRCAFPTTKRNPFIVSQCKCKEENMSRTILRAIAAPWGNGCGSVTEQIWLFHCRKNTHTIDLIMHAESKYIWRFGLRSGLHVLFLSFTQWGNSYIIVPKHV